MSDNLLLSTDVYKIGHMQQYAPGTDKVYSYLTARHDPNEEGVVFFGLQYYIDQYLTRAITEDNVDEFISIAESILGPDSVSSDKLYALQNLGYLPLEIRAVPEGTVVAAGEVLLTVTNTHPDFPWVVGYFESLLLKLWNTCTVATNSHHLKQVCLDAAKNTCDNTDHVQFQVHDFGYRGCSSEETAVLSGMSHLLSFFGTDTVPAVAGAKNFYKASAPIGLSVPASEHSVMCSFGADNEIAAFENMLKVYPTGIVSIVSDTYNFWDVMTHFTEKLYDEIISRDGKVVFRPDSGVPEKILLGDPKAADPRARKGALQLLWDQFGGTINDKGYRVLDPHVGLIYGDGIYTERMELILELMEKQNFATSNIVFGVGGLLLQQFSRDTLGFTMKATYAEVDGIPRNLFKDPITDVRKKSLSGLMALRQGKTIDKLGSFAETYDSELILRFKDGETHNFSSFQEIRDRLNG